MGWWNTLSSAWSGLPTPAKVGIGLGGAYGAYRIKRHFDQEQPTGVDYGYDPGVPEYYPGGGDEAMHALMAMQEQRQNNINSSFSTLESMFANRDPIYDRYADASYDLAKTYLDDENLSANRNLRFALARAGTSGGSVDVDKSAERESMYLDGLGRARSAADVAADQLRASDMSLKNSLMGLAAGGNVSGAQLGALARPAQSFTPSLPANAGLGQTFVGLTDLIGAARNPFRGMGGMGGGYPYSRIDSAGGQQYQGNVVTA